MTFDWLKKLVMRHHDGRVAFDVDGSALHEIDTVTLLCEVKLDAPGNELIGTAPVGTVATIVLVNSAEDICLEFSDGLKSSLVDVKATQVRLHSPVTESVPYA